ncbi:porin family protein [Sphingobium bisphenolivorans]|uniref:porin family protein n=1 Tax=Sphingobium bisphenolivorans TaxID=1335760 RepID=UPI0003A11A73|nr:porin family protein [Sphingobium bisphenolivorans]
MKTAIFAAIAAASVSVPAFAQDTAPFTGPRAGVTAGYDKFQGEEGFSYGVTAGYDVALTPRVTVGPEVSFGDSTADDAAGTKASRDIAASLRAGYVLTPQVLAFGKVGYASSRFDFAAGGHDNLEAVRYGGGMEYSVTPRTYISAEYQRTEYEGGFGGRDAGVVGVGFRF